MFKNAYRNNQSICNDYTIFATTIDRHMIATTIYTLLQSATYFATTATHFCNFALGEYSSSSSRLFYPSRLSSGGAVSDPPRVVALLSYSNFSTVNIQKKGMLDWYVEQLLNFNYLRRLWLVWALFFINL